MKVFLLMISFIAQVAHADREESFRTPAKVYGSAYSVKLTLRRDGFTYDVPMWVKPDQKQSSLDRDQLNELGWVYTDNKPEEIVSSGQTFEVPKFQNKKSDWAYLPDFARPCCYGIIGQDILRDYEIRFDPNPPAHLEWTHLMAEKTKVKESAKFQKSLAELFTLRSDKFSHKAFVLNISKNEVDFEPEHLDAKAASKPLRAPILRYEFVPPKRLAVVTSIVSGYAKSAKEVGFKASMKLIALNSIAVATLNHFEMNDYLTGKRSKVLSIKNDKEQTFIFDFEKNEFIASEPIQTPPRRN